MRTLPRVAVLCAVLMGSVAISLPAQVTQTPVSAINGGGTAITVPITIPVNGIGVTSTDGLIIKNGTDAAAGAQQMSPRECWNGNGWKTDATAASQAVSFCMENLPVQGAAAPTANLLWKYSVNGGAYSTIMTLRSDGAVLPSAVIASASLAAGTYLQAGAASYIEFATRSNIRSPADAQFTLANNAENAGFGLDVSTDAVAKFRTRAQSAYATVDVLGLNRGGVVTISGTAPTISSGFGTSPSIAASNGTAAFTINVGTGGSATSGVIGFPTATTGWAVQCADVTTQSATVYLTKQTATTTTTATIGNFDAAGAAAAWVASNILVCQAMAY